MDDYGGTGLHFATVYHVHFAWTDGYGECAYWEFGYGWHVCMSLPSSFQNPSISTPEIAR